MTGASLLATRELVVGYERDGLLPPISLDVARAQIWAVIGPNGAGKSTFVRSVLGLIPPIRGQIERTPGTRLAYVPQQANLDVIFPVRVLDFVLMGRHGPGRFVGPRRRVDVTAAESALEEAGARELAGRLLRDLSGGQRQRVLMARAIASEASVLFLDEPTAALDAAAERAILDLIGRVRQAREAAVVMVTHLVEDALALADRALLLDRDHRAAVVASAADIRAAPEFARLYGTRLAAAGAPP